MFVDIKRKKRYHFLKLQLMKTYFIQLFNYDRYANNIILKTILEAGAPEKSLQLMAHLLATQQVWLSRCKTETTKVVIFPDWKVDTFKPLIEQNHQQWTSFVNSITNWDETIVYKNSAGNTYNNTISEIITHVINHGTHHRAQIGQHLKLAGVETLPLTDFIFYVRQ